MISIVVCSIDDDLYASLCENISCTIGVAYEVIRINNKLGKYGICSAYNLGASRANFSFVCFVHEDVLFLTENWGVRLVKHLSRPGVGLVGVAGSGFKSCVPSSWSTPGEHTTINIIQWHNKSEKEHIFCRPAYCEGDTCDAVVLDGVFMATRSDVLSVCRFDEDLLKGFHGYDIDFSLQVAEKYKVKVATDILLEHYSSGTQSVEWMKSSVKVAVKWKKNLPVSSVNLSDSEQREYYREALYVFIWKMKNLRMNYITRLYGLLRFYKNKYSRKREFLTAFRYLR